MAEVTVLPPRPRRRTPAERLRQWAATPLAQLQALLLLAVALGGGGVAYGLRNLAIQLAALALLWLGRDRLRPALASAPRGLLLLVALTVLLPLAQLLPLPPALWQDLPGREAAAIARALAGLPADSWFPLSLDRGRTLTAFTALIAPLAILALGAGLPAAERVRLGRWLVVLALAALALGVVQLASANTSAMLFAVTERPDVLHGSFANRNSTALMCALALVLLAAMPFAGRQSGTVLSVAAGGLLALGAILTQSRSGMALLAVALGFAACRAAAAWLAQRRHGLPPASRRAVLGAGLAALVLTAGIAASALTGGRAADSLARLADPRTDRPAIWEDAVFAARTYWPAGSGMGTFDEVFQSHESLEHLSPRKAGRAHSDWLELAIEAGPAGPLLALTWLGWAALAVLRAPRAWRWPALGAGTGAALIAAQSLLDYPLRNQTLLCAAAVLAVLLLPLRSPDRA